MLCMRPEFSFYDQVATLALSDQAFSCTDPGHGVPQPEQQQ